jgi:2-haloacid dehalogenase
MAVAVFDALGTIFDLESLRGRLEQAGAPGAVLETWFARTLHAAAALTIIERFEPFTALATATLCSVLAQNDIDPARAPEIVEGLSELDAYPDAAPALERLRSAGIEPIVLTNGSDDDTRRLLSRAGIAVTRIETVEAVHAYKPDRRVYAQVPSGAAFVAAHAWDCAGARAAGLGAVWVRRLERAWPLPVEAPPAVDDLAEAAELVLSSGGAAP